MLLSRYFLPIIKENKKEAEIISHQLMLKAGMIRQLTSGIYTWLPLGLKVLDNVSTVVQNKLNSKGLLEMTMPCMQPSSIWKKSGRYRDGGDLAKETLLAIDRHSNELLFSPTAEEVVTQIVANNIQSYKQLPLNLYQINWKFRDEIRPRYGLMRGREFLMQDAYSFDISEKLALQSYANMYSIYLEIFYALELDVVPVRASTGSIGGNYSHEMHILSDVGESTIFFDQRILDALQNKETQLSNLQEYYAHAEETHLIDKFPFSEVEIKKSKGIEVGHLFYLGNKYSNSMQAQVQDDEGNIIDLQMGCYGIGISRLVATIIEVNNDDNGIVWPRIITPFQCILLNLRPDMLECDTIASSLYTELNNAGISTLYDDMHETSKMKFMRADLIGIPLQIIIGPRSLKESTIEIKLRKNGRRIVCSKDKVTEVCLSFYQNDKEELEKDFY